MREHIVALAEAALVQSTRAVRFGKIKAPPPNHPCDWRIDIRFIRQFVFELLLAATHDIDCQQPA